MRTAMLMTLLLMAGCATTPEEFMRYESSVSVKVQRTPIEAAYCMARNIEAQVGNVVTTTRPAEGGGAEVMAKLTGEATTTYAIIKIDPDQTAELWIAAYLYRSRADSAAIVAKGC